MNHPGPFDILAHTPWWVWALLVFIIVRGLKSRQTRVMPIGRIYIIPVLMGAWALYGLGETILTGSHYLALLPALAAIGAGWLPGVALARGIGVRADHQLGLIELEGSLQNLGLLLAVFAVKYAMGVLTALHPQLYGSIVALWILAAIDGFLIGLFAGRVHATRRHWQRAPSCSLG